MMLKKEESKMLKTFSFRWIVNVDIPFSSPPSKSSYESNHSLRRPPAYPLSPGVKRQKVSLACFLHTCYFFRSSPVPCWSKSTEGSCTVRVPPEERQRGRFFCSFSYFKCKCSGEPWKEQRGDGG